MFLKCKYFQREMSQRTLCIIILLYTIALQTNGIGNCMKSKKKKKNNPKHKYTEAQKMLHVGKRLLRDTELYTDEYYSLSAWKCLALNSVWTMDTPK